MIGSSVVPGLPNRWVMPSSLSSARKAERPVMRFFMLCRFLLPAAVDPRDDGHISKPEGHKQWSVVMPALRRYARGASVSRSYVAATEFERMFAPQPLLIFRAP